jgi:Prokaryotic Cytochrome C oxidase subunit IV
MVWALLLLLTFGSFVVGIEQGAGIASAAAAAIIGIALIKVRLIGLHFMDLRDAIWPLRLIFEGYLVAVFAVLVFIDLAITPS